MEDLIIEIPKEHKEPLTERFNAENAETSAPVGHFIIRKSCSLCEKYHEFGTCRKCPFTKFCKKVKNITGCQLWISRAIGDKHFRMDEHFIMWNKSEDKEVRKELKLLKKEATKLIRWV